MKNNIFIALMFTPVVLSAQPKPAKILYYLDSVYVSYDPLQYHRYARGVLEESDVAYVNKVKASGNVFRNVPEMGYDSVMYVFTKAYVERSTDDKKIPSTMTLDARWKRGETIYFQNGRTYTGKVTNYFFNGKKEMEGTLENGRWTGTSSYYNEDGQLIRTLAFTKRDGGEEQISADGAGHIYEKRYQKGGNLEVYSYYANGALKSSYIAADKKGKVSLDYHSNGKLKDSAYARSKWARWTKKAGRFRELQDLLMKGQFDEAFRLDPGNPGIYYWRAIDKANRLQFDSAVADMDTAITLEPLEPVYTGYRALLRVKKYAYLRDKEKFGADEYKLVWYLNENPPLPVPAEEKALMLKDLETAMVPTENIYRSEEYKAAYKSLKKE
ncbi:hypothetical protein ACFOTA_22795 [Chitinophaga sp. GCM10012297]|uniref:Antitoxin component YwqK of the YwqJK toxin-antitoxin module n=1 Tax=Chitinophaga chungangae TaxID=2821488 RepID=A0ABS3YK46_9BACT|nr:hypothetical protein [Chitinophaga chungangae]MBO9155060.1 hypothetical protein [Chitinophaga chungangae]